MDTDMMKVSVIVPVYNVEAYLERCLDSLVNQTCKEIEIIVVNDGSTDHSADIIERFDTKYEQIRVLNKPNGGLSDARNYGMPYATGEYIGFIDSDDYVDLDMYEKMYEVAKAENSDVVECNLHHSFAEYEDTEIGEKIQDRDRMLMDGRSVVWNKIYRREWLMHLGVQFPKGLIYEDVEFYAKLVPYIRTYSYVDGAYVHYVQRSSSINNFTSTRTLDILTVLQNIMDYYQERPDIYRRYEKSLEYLFIRILLCSSFGRMCRMKDKQQRKEALARNYALLQTQFPNWKKNGYLKQNRSSKGFFMKSINAATYKIYGAILPIIIQMKNGKRAWNQ